MKQLKDKLIGYGTFTLVFFVHIYFALLLGTKPALAQEQAVPPAPPAVTEAAPKKVVVQPSAASKPAKAAKDEETDINIKFDMDKGLTVKGINKVIEKAEELERRHNGHNNEEGEELDELGEDSDPVVINKNIKIKHGIGGPAVAVPLALFAMIFGIVFVIIYFKQKARSEYLATVRLLVEKGQPIPPELLNTLHGGHHAHRTTSAALPADAKWDTYESHFIKGLKPIFWGIGIACFFILESFNVEEWFFGLVFIIIGMYYVTRSYLMQKEQERISKSASQQPETK